MTSGDKSGLYIAAPDVSNKPIVSFRGALSSGLNNGKGIELGVPGETYARAMFYTDGKFGVGSGGDSRDTFLSRSAANTFRFRQTDQQELLTLLSTETSELGQPLQSVSSI